MTMRTSSRSVTFARPFTLSGIDGPQPPGTYTVETDEEQIDDSSPPAYRRIATMIRLPGRPGSGELVQVVTVDPDELAAALLRDGAPPASPERAGPAEEARAEARPAEPPAQPCAASDRPAAGRLALLGGDQSPGAGLDRRDRRRRAVRHPHRGLVISPGWRKQPGNRPSAAASRPTARRTARAGHPTGSGSARHATAGSRRGRPAGGSWGCAD